MMEVCVNLPYGVMVEQVELKFHSDQRSKVYSKYLKLLGVTKRSMVRKEELEQQNRIGDDI